jgi:hypothetical protein
MITRRVLGIGVLAMAAGDGLRRPLNAPSGGAAAVGVQPGISNGVQFARQVIVFGPAGIPVGVFVYAPGTTPGAGNPPVASLTGGTKDPYGNTVAPQLQTQNGFGSINLDGNTATFTAAASPGTGGTVVQILDGLLQVLSGTAASSGDTQATLILASADANFEGFPILIVSTVVALVAGGPEFWHNVTPPAGFAGVLRYRLMPDGTVMVQAQLTVANTVAAGAVSFGVLAAPYVATATTRGPCGWFVNGAPTVAQLAAITDMRWEAGTGGTFQVLAFPGGAAGSGVTELDFVAIFPAI